MPLGEWTAAVAVVAFVVFVCVLCLTDWGKPH